MSTGVIALSYISSLIVNAVVLLGCVSLFMWIERESENEFIKQHRYFLLCSLGIAYLALAYMEAQANNLLSRNLTGFHWTYLNMVIVGLFNLILRLRIKPQLVITLLFTMVWGISGMMTSAVSPISVEQTVGLMVVECLIYGFAKQIVARSWLYVITFIVFSFFGLSMGSMLYKGQTAGAWARQILALVVLEGVIILYARLLGKQNERIREFKHRAEFDGLTGCKTFGVFNTDLQDAYQHFTQTRKVYAMYAMDLDHFKQINDTYGHVAGNEVLKTVAHKIKGLVDNLDYPAALYRTGGEEFTMLMYEVNPDEARNEAISKMIQAEVAQLNFVFDKRQVKITISLGEDIVTANDANYLDLYKRADHFLYTSKHRGRNTITLHGQN